MNAAEEEGAALAALQARRIAQAQAAARDDVRLLAAVGGAGGFLIGRQTAAAFARGSAAAGRALPLAGLLLGAAALGYTGVEERAHLWDRGQWPPGVREAVERAEAARAAAAAAAAAAKAKAPAASTTSSSTTATATA
jgi:hypothetical protein